MVMQAYLTSVWTSRFVWQKKIPSFEEITNKNKTKKVMTSEEMLEEIKKLNALFGGTVN